MFVEQGIRYVKESWASTSLSAIWGNLFSPRRPNSRTVAHLQLALVQVKHNGLWAHLEVHILARSTKSSDSEPIRARKAWYYPAHLSSAGWTLGPRERHPLAQITHYFVSGKTRTQVRAFCCPASLTTPADFLCPALKLLMWCRVGPGRAGI